jgi:hypothetical protein
MTPEETELELRREWWSRHGHWYYLYGDDGEMQCAHIDCRKFCNFKTSNLGELRQHIGELRFARTVKEINKRNKAKT